MSIFALGDTHLSFSSDKPMNVFSGWQNYEERLKKNWSNVVGENDTVVVAGDISWAMSLEQAREDLAFIDSLPGEKLLMKGNHDYWWATKTKAEKFFEENGFSSLKIMHNNAYKIGEFAVCGSRGWFFDASAENDKKVILREAKRLQMSIDEAKKLGGEVIVFLHYPPLMTTGVCEEILEVLHKNEISRCYYAHLHGASCMNAITGDVDGVKYSLISADHLEFCPKLVEKIV